VRILLVHNSYRQPGGEDQVFEAEAALLEEHGHQVFRLTKHNGDISELGALSLAIATVWNRDAYREVRGLVQRHKVSVVHFHNTLPLISPAGYYAAQTSGAAVVQTLHNYRLLCAGATLYRDNSVCEDCVGGAVPWRGVLRRCYRNSVLASGGVAAMLGVHRLSGTWTNKVTRYIALTEFARKKFVEGGIPEHMISVKPNFVAKPSAGGRADDRARSGFLYVGRLAQVKGVASLVEAARRADVGLRIVGDGPLAVGGLPDKVVALGQQDKERIFQEMRSSAALVLPSLWYEGFPMVVAEAFAQGLPVIASDIGGLPEIIEPGVTGLLFPPGDAEALAGRLSWAATHLDAMREMGRNAYRAYVAKYSPEQNIQALISIYEQALSTHIAGRAGYAAKGEVCGKPLG
jgi:glycosyltransferase involved in cell wall biosynthesis